ncbi:MAG: hypothetical protein OEV37_03800 [Candidatus Berkelbacteria bacterium]|nr:hypothetical protein [Candidatus Berkelbacteria bacterium]
MKKIKIQRGFLIAYGAIVVLALAIGIVLARGGFLPSISADVATSTVTSGSNRCGATGIISYKEIPLTSEMQQLYGQGVSRAYEITRPDGAVLQAVFNVVNRNNPASLNFAPNTNIRVTGDVVFTVAPATTSTPGQVNRPGEFRNRLINRVGNRYIREMIWDDLPDMRIGSHWTERKDYRIPATVTTNNLAMLMYYRFSYNSRWCSITANRLMIFAPPSGGTTPTPGASATGTASATATVTGTPCCVNKCGDGTCQREVCLACGCPCAETRKTCPQDCPTDTVTPTGSVTPSPTGSVSATVTATDKYAKWRIKNGWTAIYIPQALEDVSATDIIKQGMSIFEYNANGNLKWRSSTPGGKRNRTALHRKIGYYIYNPGPDKMVTAYKVTPKPNQQIMPVIRRGWNLLANSRGIPMKLEDVKYRAVLPGYGGKCQDPNSTECAKMKACTSDYDTCSRFVNLKSLLTGTASEKRGYAKIYIIKDTHTSDPKEAFEVIDVTAKNIDTVEIPAGREFWFYLFK